MLDKIAVLFAIVFVAFVQAEPPEIDHNENYSFGYNVADPITGDTKSQSETRQGDIVQGTYSLVEPDGSTRTVNYFVDPTGGFQAQVQKSAGGAPPPAPAPVVKAAPVQYIAQPVRYVHQPRVQPVYAYQPSYFQPAIHPVYTPGFKAYPYPYAPPVYSYP